MVFQFLVAFMETNLDSADVVIGRCKQLWARVSAAVEDDADADQLLGELAKCERELCLTLARNANASLELSQTHFGVSSVLDVLLKALVKLYTTLDSTAKYFFSRTKNDRSVVDNSKFTDLVRLIDGRNLTKGIYELITHLQVCFFAGYTFWMSRSLFF